MPRDFRTCRICSDNVTTMHLDSLPNVSCSSLLHSQVSQKQLSMQDGETQGRRRQQQTLTCPYILDTVTNLHFAICMDKATLPPCMSKREAYKHCYNSTTEGKLCSCHFSFHRDFKEPSSKSMRIIAIPLSARDSGQRKKSNFLCKTTIFKIDTWACTDQILP